MRAVLLALAGLAIGGSAHAQVITGGDTRDAMTAQINAAVAASQAQTNTAMSALQAQIPKAATSIPPVEAIAGAVGSAGTYRPGNAVQPRITRSKTVTLDTTGSATFDWTSQGALTTPIQVALTPVYAGAAVPSCWATATSATAVSIKCAMGGSTSLSLSALTAAGAAGLSLNPFSAGVQGMQVGVIALPPS